MIFTSCYRKTVYNESVAIENLTWNYQQKAFFEVNIQNTHSIHDFYLNVRHLENYRYSNLYVFLNIEFPSGVQTRDTIECILAFPDGKWVGKSSGKLIETSVLLNPCLKFPEEGIYHFEVEQGMRETNLEGISDIGISIRNID